MLEAPRRAPRLAGADPRWRSTLTSTFYAFKVLSNSDRAPVFLFVSCTCLDQAGKKVWLGLARGFLPGGLQALNQLHLSRLGVQGLDLGRSLVVIKWSGRQREERPGGPGGSEDPAALLRVPGKSWEALRLVGLGNAQFLGGTVRSCQVWEVGEPSGMLFVVRSLFELLRPPGPEICWQGLGGVGVFGRIIMAFGSGSSLACWLRRVRGPGSLSLGFGGVRGLGFRVQSLVEAVRFESGALFLPRCLRSTFFLCRGHFMKTWLYVTSRPVCMQLEKLIHEMEVLLPVLKPKHAIMLASRTVLIKPVTTQSLQHLYRNANKPERIPVQFCGAALYTAHKCLSPRLPTPRCTETRLANLGMEGFGGRR